MIVAIDGPAGSGKSTVARTIAQRRGFIYLDTGAMYRSVTLACLDNQVDIADAETVAHIASNSTISFASDNDQTQHVYLNGKDVTQAIREERVDSAVSLVSAIPAVRECMGDLQRKLGEQGSIVAEGRDIGTVVFPHAEVKVFLTANAEARAHRRAVQRDGGNAAQADKTVSSEEEKQILADIERRDKMDSTRSVAPLTAAADAVQIDSSNLTVDEVCAKIEALIDAKSSQSSSEDKTPQKTETSQQTTKQPAKATPQKKVKTTSGPMPWWGNTIADYHAHQIPEFPLGARIFRWIAISVVAIFSKLMWRWTVEDRQKIVEATKERGVVLVMNHVSMLDPIVAYLTFVALGLRIRPIYKDEFNDQGPLGKILAWVGGISVRRGTADLKALRNAQHTLESGDSILVFPEGTRIKSDDEPVTIHGGFALMARMGKAKVLPMAIVGARDITPRGHHIPRPKKVWTKVGDPISFEELGIKGRKEQAEAMEKVAMERVYALRDELRKEHPGQS